jgi:hypothetical protein
VSYLVHLPHNHGDAGALTSLWLLRPDFIDCIHHRCMDVDNSRDLRVDLTKGMWEGMEPSLPYSIQRIGIVRPQELKLDEVCSSYQLDTMNRTSAGGS